MVLFQTCKDTKFESNSQLVIAAHSFANACIRRAKIQNLSANHNVTLQDGRTVKLFQTCKDTKFESNSQSLRLPFFYFSMLSKKSR